MSDYYINIKNLQVARQNTGFSTEEATHAVCGKNSKTDKVALWESGENKPTLNQLQKLAKSYQVSFFTLTAPEELPRNKSSPDFRSISTDKKLSLNLKKYINFLYQRQQYCADVLQKEGIKKNALLGSGNKTNPIELAEFIREQLGYNYTSSTGKTHLKYLIQLIEKQGIFVMKTLSYWQIDVAEMRGAYIKNDYAPIIALNRKDAKTAQVFTLAHEIAHAFINNEGISSIESNDQNMSQEEKFCDEVAANFLLPEKLFDGEYYTLREIQRKARKLELSELFIFYRLKNLRKIQPENLQSYKENIKERMDNAIKELDKKTDVVGGHYHNNMKDTNGNLFTNFVTSLYFEQKLNAFEASKLLRMPIENV